MPDNNKVTFFKSWRITVTVTGLLPVTLVSFKGYTVDNGNRLEWITANEVNMETFQVEKSADGVTFIAFSTVPAKNGTSQQYSSIDLQPYNGTTFYRLKINHRNGAVQYSSIVRLDRQAGQASIKVYPNPVTNKMVNLQFVHAPKGRYALEVYNVTGQLLMKQMIDHPGASASVTIHLPVVVAGYYVLKVRGGINAEQMLLVE